MGYELCEFRISEVGFRNARAECKTVITRLSPSLLELADLLPRNSRRGLLRGRHLQRGSAGPQLPLLRPLSPSLLLDVPPRQIELIHLEAQQRNRILLPFATTSTPIPSGQASTMNLRPSPAVWVSPGRSRNFREYGNMSEGHRIVAIQCARGVGEAEECARVRSHTTKRGISASGFVSPTPTLTMHLLGRLHPTAARSPRR